MSIGDVRGTGEPPAMTSKATLAKKVADERKPSATFLVLTEHVCGCGHRCSGLSPIGMPIACDHRCTE